MAYIGKQPTVGNFVKLDTITTSATATYNLLNGGVAYSPQSANHCIVSLNGVIQEPTSASNVGGFTISGSTIVFTSALTSLDVIDFILVLGDVLNIGTPSDATVGFAKVTSNLITGATAETSIAGGDSVLIYDDSASALRKMTRTNFISGLANTPAFSAYQSTAQTITSATFTKMNFQTEELDSDNNFASSRFTPTTSGYYFFTVNFSVASSATSGLIAFYKNGTEFKKSAYLVVSSVNQLNASSGLINLNGSTDYIEAYIYLATGQNLTGASTATWFTGFRVTGI